MPRRSGPSVRENLDLTSIAGLTVHTMSTFATVCALLGLEVPHAVDGQARIEALTKAERSAPES